MANTLLTMSMITREALMVLENQLTFTKFVNRQYDDKFAIAGAKIGDTLNVRKPPRYQGRRGAALSVEDATETSVPVVLDTQYGCDISFTSADLALRIDDFSQRFIVPAIAAVVNAIDYDGMQLYKKVWNVVGTPGTVPTDLSTYLDAGVALDNSLCPRGDGLRSMVINPRMQGTLVNALKGLFQDSTEVARQYKEGTMGRTAGFKFSMDQNTATHTVGPLGGVPLVNNAGQTGSNLVTDGWTAAAALRLKEGDTFTIAGVYQVNLQNRTSIGVLQNFRVTADAYSDAGGNVTIPIDPPITPAGSSQTVSASPADNAPLTINGAANTATPQGLAFHRDAFAFACADLPLPGGVDKAARVSSKQLGISLRMVRAYDINQDKFPCRLDLLGGWAMLRQELACRVQS